MYCENKFENLVKSKDDLLNPDFISKYQMDENPKRNFLKKGINESRGEGLKIVNVDNNQSVPRVNVCSLVKWPLIDFVNIDLNSYGKIKCCNVSLVAATSQNISKGPIPGCSYSSNKMVNSSVNKSVECSGVENNGKTIIKGFCNENYLMRKEISYTGKDSNLLFLKGSQSHKYHHALNFSEMRNIPLHHYGWKYRSTNLYNNIKSITTPYSIENLGVAGGQKENEASSLYLSMGDKVSENSKYKGKCIRQYFKEKPQSYQISSEFKKTLDFSLHACSEFNHNIINNPIYTEFPNSVTDNNTDRKSVV